jgi:hypothetical protein
MIESARVAAVLLAGADSADGWRRRADQAILGARSQYSALGQGAAAAGEHLADGAARTAPAALAVLNGNGPH